MSVGLEGREDRDFTLNMNFNINLANLVLHGNFDGDGSKWIIFNVFGRVFPVGTKFTVKRMLYATFINSMASSSTLEIMKNGLTSIVFLGKGAGSTGISDTGLIDKEYEQVLDTDFINPRLYKDIPIGATGNLTGSAQLYCKWLVRPTEV